jgi:adenylate cyclase
MVEIHQKLNNKIFDIDEQFSEGKINTIKKYSGGYTNVDSNGFQILIDYPRSNYVPKYSIESILNKNFSKDFFKNKMIVIGATAPSLKDIFAFPSSRFIKDSQLMYLSGAEIHAHRANQLFSLQNGNTLQINTINPTLELFLIILLTLSTALYIEKSKKILYGLLGLIIIISSLSIAVFLSFISGYWIEFALPIISIILVSTVSWVKKAAEQQKQKALMQKLLGQTTSPEVAEELWKQKDELIENGKFPGIELPVTILFSDTVSFSSVSEKMTPTELLDWLNTGIEKFVKIISKNGGMVNKFTGDGFLAVFGAPVKKSYEESSYASINTAIEIRKEIDNLSNELKEKKLPLIRLRIGVHSGKIITGSMGGSEKIEYALIGDTVNVASRLESLEKEKMSNNCRILVSGDSLKYLKNNKFNIVSWGERKVKGRDSSVEVFEIL